MAISWWHRGVKGFGTRRAASPEVTVLEDRCTPSTVTFVQPLGVAAHALNNQTSLDLITTGPVKAGHDIFLTFAMRPASGNVTAFAHAAGSSAHLVDFQVDADATSTQTGGAVRTIVLSALGVPALGKGRVITIKFPASAAQAASAAEFAGISAARALDRVIAGKGSGVAVSSGVAATTRNANELLIGAAGVAGPSVAGTADATHNLGFTAGARYTVWPGSATTASAGNVSIHPEYRAVTSTGTYRADGKLAVGGPWATLLAAYRADATSRLQIYAPATVVAGQPFVVTVVAKDPQGHTGTGFTGTVHWSSTDADPAIKLPADYTFTAADAGTHQFTLTLRSDGLRSLSVTDTANVPTIAGSAAVHVNPYQLRVSAPSASFAGKPVAVTVTARRYDGSTDTSYRGTVHFSTTDAGKAVVPLANYPFTAADAGSHPFTGLVLVTAGNQTVTATDTVTKTVAGTSAAIAVGATAATHFGVSTPATATAGNPFLFAVTALDPYNNPATDYNGTVQFRTIAGNASLPNDSTLTKGTGTFDATLRTAGSQTITATDKADAHFMGVSDSIAVGAAAARHFAVVVPSPVPANTPFSFTVAALDPYGNVATGYIGTVHFSTTGQASLPADGTLKSGTATFSATATAAHVATLTIVAADSQAPAVTGASSVITVGLLAVFGTDGNDTPTVDRGPTGTAEYVLNGAPMSLRGFYQFEFHGQGGDDTLTLITDHGPPLLSDGIFFDGGGGTNTLTVDADSWYPVRTTPGIFNVGDQAVNYSNVTTTHLGNAISINAAAGPDTADRATAFENLSAAERAVQALYLDSLGRAGSKAELDGFAALLPAGATSLSSSLVSAIEGSIEARDHLVKGWWQTYLGRLAVNNEEAPYVNELASGLTEEQVLSQVLGSAEFYARAQTLIGTGTADERYMQALFGLLLNRTAGPDELAGYVNALPGVGQQNMALSFLQSTEFRSYQFLGYYTALLHHVPGASDQASFNALVNSNLDMGIVRRAFETTTDFFTDG